MTNRSCRPRKASNSPAMASRVAITPSRSSASMALTVGPAPSSKSSSSLPRRSPSAGSSGSAASTRFGRRAVDSPGGRAAVGLFEVDHLAQQDAAAAQLLAPHHDGLEGQGAFAQTADHGVAAGLDALGDGDLALAAEQLDRAHLAQVHAHRIVGAVVVAFLGRAFGDRGLLADRNLAALGRLAVFLGLDDIHAHLAEHGQGVFDRLGGDFLGRQHLVQLVHGDVAAGLGLLDELLDARVRQIEQRAVSGGFGFYRLSRIAHLNLQSRGGDREAAPFRQIPMQTTGQPFTHKTRPPSKPFPTRPLCAERPAQSSSSRWLPCQRGRQDRSWRLRWRLPAPPSERPARKRASTGTLRNRQALFARKLGYTGAHPARRVELRSGKICCKLAGAQGLVSRGARLCLRGALRSS